MLKKAGVLCGAMIIVCSMLVWAERRSVDLTSVMPRQDILRIKRAAVGEWYRQEDAINIPENGMIIEGNVGIGTTDPKANLHVGGSAKIGDKVEGITHKTIPNDGGMFLSGEMRFANPVEHQHIFLTSELGHPFICKQHHKAVAARHPSSITAFSLC